MEEEGIFLESDFCSVDTDSPEEKILRESICKADFEAVSIQLASLRRKIINQKKVSNELDNLLPQTKDNRPWLNIVSQYLLDTRYLPDNMIFSCILSFNKFFNADNLLFLSLRNMILLSYKETTNETKIRQLINIILEDLSINLKEILIILVALKSDINVQTKKGFTPLMMATIMSDTDLISLCLALGANKNIKNTNGLTALDLVSPDLINTEEIINTLTVNQIPSLNTIKINLLKTYRNIKREKDALIQTISKSKNVKKHIEELVDDWKDIVMNNNVEQATVYANSTIENVILERRKRQMNDSFMFWNPFYQGQWK